MTDSRFFQSRGPFSLRELADMTGAELAAGADPTFRIEDIAALNSAGPTDVSFLENRRYIADFRTCKAGA